MSVRNKLTTTIGGAVVGNMAGGLASLAVNFIPGVRNYSAIIGPVVQVGAMIVGGIDGYRTAAKTDRETQEMREQIERGELRPDEVTNVGIKNKAYAIIGGTVALGAASSVVALPALAPAALSGGLFLQPHEVRNAYIGLGTVAAAGIAGGYMGYKNSVNERNELKTMSFTEKLENQRSQTSEVSPNR